MQKVIGLGAAGAVIGGAIGFLTKPQPALSMLTTADPDATYQSAIVSHVLLYGVIGLILGAGLGVLATYGMQAKGK
jgi:hypothetical protein